MTRRYAGLFLIMLVLSAGWPAASAQSAPEPLPVGAGAVGLVTSASMRLGTQVAAECGSGDYPAAPYGDGLGFLQHGKQLHWRIAGDMGVQPPFGIPGVPRPRPGRFDLCGVASVPLGGVPEIGAAGPCDSVQASGGRGVLAPPDAPEGWSNPPQATFTVQGVGWPSAGSVIALTGTIPGSAEQAPGKLVMLLQRRSTGMCLHNGHDELPAPAGRHPQGSTAAELVGVAAWQLPRATESNTACADHWGQVRRHLRGAGAGLECPVPAEI